MRKLIKFAIPAIALFGAVIASRTMAEPKEAAPPQAVGESATSSVRIQEMAPMTLFYTTIRTTYERLGAEVGPIIGDLEKTVHEKNLEAQGMVVFLYEGASEDPTKEFELSIGMPVVEGTQAFDKWQVKDFPKFKCATVMHSGGVRSIASAYQKLFPEIFAKGLQPTGVNREFYLYWEGEDSENNVMLIQVGVK